MQAEAVFVREALPTDAPAMVQCDAYAQSHACRQSFIRAAAAKGGGLVAVANGSVVGFLVLTHTFFEQAFVSLVVVEADHQRRGVGSRLLAAAEASCKTSKLFSSTNASNVVAQALLSKARFVRSGIVENLDAEDPELIYFKSVGAVNEDGR